MPRGSTRVMVKPQYKPLLQAFRDHCETIGVGRAMKNHMNASAAFMRVIDGSTVNPSSVAQAHDSILKHYAAGTLYWSRIKKFLRWGVAAGHFPDLAGHEQLLAPSPTGPRPVPRPPLHPVLAEYLADCRLRNLSPATLQHYEERLRQWIAYAGWPADRMKLADYLQRFTNDRTKSIEFRAVKSFVRWAAKEGRCQDWVTGIRMRFKPAAPAEVLTPDEFERVLAKLPQGLHGERYRVLYQILYFTGGRRGGILTLEWRNVDFASSTIRIDSKGKEHVIVMPAQAMEVLSRWQPRCPSERWVFPSTRHPQKPLQGNAASRKIAEAAKAAGITKRVYPHLLRHTHATQLVEAGVSIDVVSQRLGHSNLSTTQIYAKVSRKRQRDAVDRLFGVAQRPAPASAQATIPNQPPELTPPMWKDGCDDGPPTKRSSQVVRQGHQPCGDCAPAPKTPAPAALDAADVSDWI